jgi:DNA-binding response OmpR family regulator
LLVGSKSEPRRWDSGLHVRPHGPVQAIGDCSRFHNQGSDVTNPRTILVVEDDESLRRFWRSALKLEGFRVLEAMDGLHALHVLDEYIPDLVVLDLGLPKVDGVSVRQEIAAQVLTRDIPVVVVTGSTEELGHLDVPCVLRKPISADQLLAAIRKCLPAGPANVRA